MGVRRHSLKEIDDLAKRVITGQLWMPRDAYDLRHAFYMLTALAEPGTFENAANLLGDMGSVVPGRAMNGCPIFTSCIPLHVNDMPYFNAALERKMAALNA